MTGVPPENSVPVKDNLEFWNALKRTDPKATKPFQRAGGFRGTQIDPAWRMQMMTEVFGPVGKGWGYEQIEWTIAERMFFSLCRVWYVDPHTGEKHFTGPQWGGTELVRRNRDGTERPDDEAPKMSVTDAIGKCMLQVGLAADIYLGQFDDSKYREESEVFYTVKSNPDLQPPAVEKFEADLKEKLDALPDLDALDDLWSSGINARIREIGTVDKAAQNRMITAFSLKKNEILKEIERQESGEAPPPPKAAPKPQAKPQDKPSNFKPVQQKPEDQDPGAPIPTRNQIQDFIPWFERKVAAAQQAEQLEALWADLEKRINAIAGVDQEAEEKILKTYNDRMKIFSHNAQPRQRRAG